MKSKSVAMFAAAIAGSAFFRATSAPPSGLFFADRRSAGRSLRLIVVCAMTAVVVFPILSDKWSKAGRQSQRASAERISMVSAPHPHWAAVQTMQKGR